MDYGVSVVHVQPQPTAVIAAVTTWQELPVLWPQLSGEVWDCLRANGITRGCRNVMLYVDGRPSVEVGVLLDQPCTLTGRVTRSTLPGGTVATTVHRGPFTELGSAHGAVLAWCSAHGLMHTGTRWEVYGPHADDASEQWTEISWLLAESER
jgi:effector-binding domain-containing protein